MNRKLVQRLILFLVDQLQDLDAPISTIRLVKFLYLIDLENFHRYGETLTGIEWMRYKYGPYFFDLPEIIRSSSIDLDATELETERGKGVVYKALEPQSISGLVPFATENMIIRIVQTWAHEDLKVLLQYVYSTDPVRNAEYGKRINFEQIRRMPVVASPAIRRRKPFRIQVPSDVSERIQEMLNQRKEKEVQPMNDFVYDSFYFDALRIMDEEDSSVVAFEGKVNISQEALDLLLSQTE